MVDMYEEFEGKICNDVTLFTYYIRYLSTPEFHPVSEEVRVILLPMHTYTMRCYRVLQEFAIFSQNGVIYRKNKVTPRIVDIFEKN